MKIKLQNENKIGTIYTQNENQKAFLHLIGFNNL